MNESIERSQTERIIAVVRGHRIDIGTMASPRHWSYEAKHRGEGNWFAYCSSSVYDGSEVGCGWDSKPFNYRTREEAWAAAYVHLAAMIEQALD